MSLGPRLRARHIVARHALVYRHDWRVMATGFLEPVLYLLSIGIGVGAMISGFEVDGTRVPYAAFVAPAMMATAAMTGAVMDSTYNLFFRMKYAKLYDAMLATPLTTTDVAVGETAWALLRGGLYAAGFLVVMAALGLVSAATGVLALPASLLIGFAFAGLGMYATTFMKSWQDFEYVTLAMMPMMLFSGTFFPIDDFSGPVRWLIEATPLYRGVVLCREATTGTLGWASVVSVVYLAVLGVSGLYGARRRLGILLLR